MCLLLLSYQLAHVLISSEDLRSREINFRVEIKIASSDVTMSNCCCVFIKKTKSLKNINTFLKYICKIKRKH